MCIFRMMNTLEQQKHCSLFFSLPLARTDDILCKTFKYLSVHWFHLILINLLKQQLSELEAFSLTFSLLFFRMETMASINKIYKRKKGFFWAGKTKHFSIHANSMNINTLFIRCWKGRPRWNKLHDLIFQVRGRVFVFEGYL